jgi:putative ABC transport system permease protein
VVLLARRVWLSRYGGDPALVGRSILIDGMPTVVAGVLPDRSGFPGPADVWLTLPQMPAFAADRRDARTLRVFGRLRDGVSLRAARAEIESIVTRIARDHPRFGERLEARVVPINDRFLGRPTDPAWLAFTAAAILVWLVSSANVAILLLARGALRAREVAIRASLGASQGRVAAQLLTESALLAVLGGIVGLGISMAGVRLFRAGIPDNVLPGWLDYGMDARVFAALVAMSLGAVLVFGVVPAMLAARTDVNRTLKAGAQGMAGTRAGRRLAAAFLAVEIALTVVLAAQVVATVRAARPELPSEAAIRAPDLLAASIALLSDRYRTPAARGAFYRRLDERLEGLPDVVSHTLASVLPARPAPERQIETDESQLDARRRAPSVRAVAIGPAYFATLGMPLVRGREFSDGEARPGRMEAIVNDRFAQMFFSDRDPLGRRIRLTVPGASTTEAPWHTIVGVVPAIRQPSDDPDAVAYVPFLAAPPATGMLIVRSRIATATIAQRLRDAALDVDPAVPLYQVMTLRRAVEDAGWNARVSRRLILALTLITLAFSTVGLYAVTAHGVSRRLHEVGVRVALGARPSEICRLIVGRAAGHVALGLAAGIGGTMAWDAVFFSGRVDLTHASPGALLPLAAMLALVTLAACLVPVRRAMRLDPAVVLRQD